MKHFTDQAGGHNLIKHRDGVIYKPTKKMEYIFYAELLSVYTELSEFTPKFYGGGTIDAIIGIPLLFTDDEIRLIREKKYTHYIKLENLLASDTTTASKTASGIVLDIKLGTIHWKTTTNSKKIKAMKLRNTNSVIDQMRFRLDGYIAKLTGKHMFKEECRALSKTQVLDVFRDSLTVENIEYINGWLDRLSNVLLTHVTLLNIYGPSVLIIITDSRVECKLIDFTSYEDLIQVEAARDSTIHQDLYVSLMALKQVLDMVHSTQTNKTI